MPDPRPLPGKPPQDCPACGHSLDSHFRAESGRVVCIVSESGVSTRGVIGLPWSHGCDCIDGHSPEADEEREEKREEEEKRNRLYDDIRKHVGQLKPEKS